MPILLSDNKNENDRWKKKEKKNRKKERDDGSYSESVRAKWFCYALS